MDEFQKEEALQIHLVRTELEACSKDDVIAIRRVCRHAVKVAYERLFTDRFGAFSGDDKTILYVSMGPTNQWICDGLRRRLREAAVRVLAVATWPQEGASRGYSFAIVIDSPNCMHWLDVACDVFVTDG